MMIIMMIIIIIIIIIMTRRRMVMTDIRQASCSLGTSLPIDLFPQHHTLVSTCMLIYFESQFFQDEFRSHRKEDWRRLHSGFRCHLTFFLMRHTPDWGLCTKLSHSTFVGLLGMIEKVVLIENFRCHKKVILKGCEGSTSFIQLHLWVVKVWRI